MSSFQEISNSQVKLIKALATKRYRTKHKLFIAEGRKVLKELFESNFNIKKCWLAEQIDSNNGLEYDLISPTALSKVSHLQNPHFGLAIVEIPNETSANNDQIQLVLDGISDPGNLGTIIRLADWYGIKSINCVNNCVDAFNPKVVQATMGSIFRVNIVVNELENLEMQPPVYGAVMDGKSIYNLEKTEKCTLVIGSEADGISNEVLKLCSEKITIPKKGRAESLNAGVATGIILDRLTQVLQS